MEKRHRRIEPVVTIQENNYKVCSLNCNLENPEFYYHFAYRKDIKKAVWNYNLQRVAGRPDHISFHKDGTIHLSLKEERIKLGIKKPINDSFIPLNMDTMTPLLVHSIYQIDGEYGLPLIKEALNNPVIKTNRLLKSGNFSVIIFLTPEKISQSDFLGTLWWNSPIGRIPAQLLGSPAGRVSVWDGWAIDYVLTDLTLELPSNLPPDLYYSAFAYIDLDLIFKDFLSRRINYKVSLLNFTL